MFFAKKRGATVHTIQLRAAFDDVLKGVEHCGWTVHEHYTFKVFKVCPSSTQVQTLWYDSAMESAVEKNFMEVWPGGGHSVEVGTGERTVWGKREREESVGVDGDRLVRERG